MEWWQVTLDVVRTVATVAVPVVVAVLGYRLNRRLKLWEADQWRNQELIRARLAYYQVIAPQLNDLMCFFGFIGDWKRFTPPAIIELKRKLDRDFYTASPLFSEASESAFSDFMDVCFETFGTWDKDAKLRTGYGRRRSATTGWDGTWEPMFTHGEEQRVTKEELAALRSAYDAVLGALARDVALLDARERYLTGALPINAH